MKFFKDLFYGFGNQAADLGRILGALAFFLMIGAAVWNMHLGLPIELDKLGLGLAGVITASAALIYAKDRARTEATVAPIMAETAHDQSTLPAPSSKGRKRK